MRLRRGWQNGRVAIYAKRVWCQVLLPRFGSVNRACAIDPSQMPVYSVFGGFLQSDVPFDGLQPSPTTSPTWTFRVDRAMDRAEKLIEIGREQVSSELTIVLSRASDGTTVLSYSAYGLGIFRISADGRHIVWTPGAELWEDALRWVLLGRVMATAMYVGGTLCLHGSAIALATEGICFLAPKFHGKSTLAAAMVAAGGRLVTDDVLPIDAGPPVRMRPGVPVLRLYEDSEAVVALGGRGHGRANQDVGKARLDFSGEADVVTTFQTLSAVYILAPQEGEPEPGRVAVRSALTGVRALEMIVRHSSIAPLLSSSEAPLLLAQASAIVRSVPIYILRSIRALGRLPEIVETLREWHGEEARG